MVQLKYFGDSRDFFKYDLITSALEQSSLRNYVFIPMLTDHRVDNEGRKVPRNEGDKSQELLDFVNKCGNKSLTHWKTWLSPHVECYKTEEPVDGIYSSDKTRDQYWKPYYHMMLQEKALVFVDPDTGLETGTPSYLKRKGREKYILDSELECLIQCQQPTSVLMIYQHLPNDKNKHAEAVSRKLRQVRAVDKTVYACAYREDDLAFLFIAKSKSSYEDIFDVLKKYYKRSLHKYKSLHESLPED